MLLFTFLISFGFQVNIDFEPFKPINTSLYLCDNKFHTGGWSDPIANINLMHIGISIKSIMICACCLIVLLQPEALTALLADDNRFGFIVMDGNGALFGTLQVGQSVYV